MILALSSMALASALASVKELHRAASAPSCSCQQALSASRRDSGAMPLMPWPLPAFAAITPATAVP